MDSKRGSVVVDEGRDVHGAQALATMLVSEPSKRRSRPLLARHPSGAGRRQRGPCSRGAAAFSSARRRSARLAGIEPSEYVSIIQKATQRMRVLKEGKISAGGKALLPVQLIDLAPEVSSPLPRQDVLELAAACDVPASALLDDTACV
nr:uncharacterized protein LOC109774862 isoform X2 [Aegilops tauschii subsp. strangulata]